MTQEVGETYLSPCQMIFVVVEATPIGVVALLLHDLPGATAPLRAGTLMNILDGCAFWNDSVPFASLPDGFASLLEGGTVGT